MTLQELTDINLLEVFGLHNLPKEEQEKLVAEATMAAFGRALEDVEDELPDEHLDEFLTLFYESPGTEEEQKAFLDKHVPDFEEIMIAELLALKAEALVEQEKMPEEGITPPP